MDLELIDYEIVPQSVALNQERDDQQKDGSTRLQREHALQLLIPSSCEAMLGPGWDQPETLTSGSDSDDGTSLSSLSSSVATGRASSTSDATFSKALLVRSCSQGWSLSFELHSSYPVPQLISPDQILVRNVAVGLNPVDWKSVSYNFGIAGLPWVLGRDVAGTVVAIGDDITNVQVGDRVWTCADSRDSAAGGYQTYSVHNNTTVARTPDNVTDVQAATLGTGLVTAAVILYCCFGLTLPSLAMLQQAERSHHSPASLPRPTKRQRTCTSVDTTASSREGRPRFVL